MMKIKYKAPLWIFAATLVTAIILVYSNYQTNVTLIERAKKVELQTVATLIQNDLLQQGTMAASKVALLIDRPDIREAFRAKDREGLTKLALPSFTTLKNKFGVREAQFNDPGAVVFLRLHNLPTFGDDDSSFREMILMAEKNKKPYQGIEIGRSGVNIRAIDIVQDDKGVIGTFEVGMSFGTILENIKKNVNFDMAVFINDALMTKVATSRPRPGPERIFGDLQGIGATDWAKILPYVNADMLNKVTDVTLMTKRIDGTDYGIVLMPLLDFKNADIGVIVAISDYSNYQAATWGNLVKSIALTVFQILVITAIALVTFRVLLLRPIEHINETMVAWKKGDKEKSISNLAKRDDEIGELSSNIEALNKKPDEQ